MYKTSIVINASSVDHEYVAALIESIRRFTERGTYELIVVEHGGAYKLKEWLANQTDILTLFNELTLTEGQVWNRGINIASGNSIVLLHGDTLVTEYWLDYMLQSLYQDEDIAGVGPVTNYAVGDQALEVSYENMEGMLQFGRSCNRSFGLKQQLTLAGFCLHLKKDVIDAIGPFHEQLEGNEIIVDYCLRITDSNYKLMVCTNVFVHHYGLERDNEHYLSGIFKAKWGSSVSVKSNLPKLKAFLQSDLGDVRILVVGSGFGELLLDLHFVLPEAEIHGVETDLVSQRISRGINNDLINVSNSLENYTDHESFDYIILNTTYNVKQTLKLCQRLLKPNGELIIDLPNPLHYSFLTSLMNGGELSGHQFTDWSVESLTLVLDHLNFEVCVINTIKDEAPSDYQGMMSKLKSINSGTLPKRIEIQRFLVTAKKVVDSDILHEQFAQLFQNPNEEIVSRILQSSSSTILKAVNTYNGPVTALLNYLAISYYERNEIKDVFPLLSRAYELNAEDATTLLNLGTVYYGTGDDEKALYWLEKIQEKNEQIKEWIYQLRETIGLKKDSLKWTGFLFLQIEHGVRREEAMDELIELLDKKNIDLKTIQIAMEDVVENKLNTINMFVNYLYDQNQMEHILDILELTLIYQTDCDETLFTLANLSQKQKKYKRALNYLNMLTKENEKAVNLKENILNLQLAERIRM